MNVDVCRTLQRIHKRVFLTIPIHHHANEINYKPAIHYHYNTLEIMIFTIIVASMAAGASARPQYETNPHEWMGPGLNDCKLVSILLRHQS
jgi:hypothetical protein